MGYNIRVDHSKFEAAANAIDQYNSNMKSKMKNADTAVNTMLSSWKGEDATAFVLKWNEVNGSESTYMAFYKSMKSYAEYLREAASRYKTAQANAINRANRLPRW